LVVGGVEGVDGWVVAVPVVVFAGGVGPPGFGPEVAWVDTEDAGDVALDEVFGEAVLVESLGGAVGDSELLGECVEALGVWVVGVAGLSELDAEVCGEWGEWVADGGGHDAAALVWLQWS